MIDTDELKKVANPNYIYGLMAGSDRDMILEAAKEIDTLRIRLQRSQDALALEQFERFEHKSQISKLLHRLNEIEKQRDEARTEIAEHKRHIEALRDYKRAAKKLIDELTRERDEARRWARKYYRLTKWYQSVTDRNSAILREEIARSSE